MDFKQYFIFDAHQNLEYDKGSSFIESDHRSSDDSVAYEKSQSLI